MEFCIHILLKVQGNDLTNISFHPSSSLIVHPHFSRFDKVQTNDLTPTSLCPSPLPFMYHHSSKVLDEATRTLHACLEYEIKVCEANGNMFTSVIIKNVSIKLIENALENLEQKLVNIVQIA